jgi:hypothetical protein
MIDEADLLRRSMQATHDTLRKLGASIPGSGDGVRGLLALGIAYETALSSEVLAGDEMKARAATIRAVLARLLEDRPNAGLSPDDAGLRADVGLRARRVAYLVTLDANRGVEVLPEEVVVRSGELLVEIAKQQSDDTAAAAGLVALGAASELVLRRIQIGTGTRFRQIVQMITNGWEETPHP